LAVRIFLKYLIACGLPVKYFILLGLLAARLSECGWCGVSGGEKGHASGFEFFLPGKCEGLRVAFCRLAALFYP
jgi:hypothetical protein